LEFSFSHEKDGELLNPFPPDYNTPEIMIVSQRGQGAIRINPDSNRSRTQVAKPMVILKFKARVTARSPNGESPDHPV
jgi:hypothetical protein